MATRLDDLTQARLAAIAHAVNGGQLSQAQGMTLAGPSGTVTARYGNEAGATFNAAPNNTAGLRAGAVVQDAGGSQWMVDDNYQWTPYTGAGQWQNVSSIDDARQKLVQDWYNSGKDPANTQAAAMESYLKDAGRLGAREPRAGGPITRENIGALKAGLDAGGVVSGGTGGGVGASGGGVSPTGGGVGGVNAYGASSSGGGVTEPWNGTMPTIDPFSYGPAPTYGGNQYENRRDQLLNQLEGSKFSYDPANDPVWQAYQKQYRREGQRAAEDALGRAAASTGGVASSYAAQAASQAGNYYAAQLSDRLPQVYQDAYNRYLQEYERQLGLADTYNSLGQQDYNRFRDTLAQYNNDRNFAYGVYSDDYNRAMDQYGQGYKEHLDEMDRRSAERNWEYSAYLDELDRQERADQTAYNREQDALDRAEREAATQYGKEQDAMNWWWTMRQDEYKRGLDAEDKARQDLLDSMNYQQNEYNQSQQLFENAWAIASSMGVVPEGWVSEVLNLAPGTVVKSTSTGSGGGGGGNDSGYRYSNLDYDAMRAAGLTNEAQIYNWFKSNGFSDAQTQTKFYLAWLKEQEAADQDLAQNIQNGYGAAQIQNWLHDEGQKAVSMPTASGTSSGSGGGVREKYTSLDYDTDEGIFTWNGKKYSSLGQLSAALQRAGVTEDEIKALNEKLRIITGGDIQISTY